MRLKAYRYLGDPQPLIREAAVVLVEHEDGTPLAVVQEIGKSLDGRSIIGTAMDASHPDFNAALRRLGVDKLVVVDNLEGRLARSHHEIPQLPQLG